MRSVSASLPGEYHILNRIPCQDAVMSYSDEDIVVGVLADGAGSYADSQTAALVSVEAVLENVKASFAEIFAADDAVVAERIIETAKKACAVYDTEPVCTMLVFAKKGEDVLAVHIGDGYIFEVSEDGASVLSMPENGSEPGQTFFLSMPSALRHVRIYRGVSEGTDTVVLCSDGAGDALYDKVAGRPAEAVRVFSEWMKDGSNEEIQEALDEAMDRIQGRTTDDVSICICAF